jgi:hypothetical protein
MRVRTNGARVALRLIVTLALVLPAVTLPGASAYASHCSGDNRIDERGGEVDAECRGEAPGGSGSSTMEELWARYCTDAGPYRPGDEVGFYEVAPVSPEHVEAVGLDPTGEYVWYDVICWRDGREAAEVQIIVEVTPAVPPEVVRDQVAARIDPPTPVPATSPPLERHAVVRIPTWLFLDAGYWVPLEVSESRGVVTVTVRATPTQASWVMGDSGEVTCYGPGAEWRSGLSEDDTDCSYTYVHSSYGRPGGRFEASVTVVWEFEWWLNGAYQGSFGTVDVSTDFAVAVGEIQAIETKGD